MNQPYTRTPNWFYDALPTLSGAEVKLLSAVMRQTFGWHRAEAELTIEALQQLSGINSRTTINRAVMSLAEHGYLLVRAVGKRRFYQVPEAAQTPEPVVLVPQRANAALPPPLVRDGRSDQKLDTSVQKLDASGKPTVQKLDSTVQKMDTSVQKLDTTPPCNVQKMDTSERALKKKDVKKALKKEEEESATAAPLTPVLTIYQETFRRTLDVTERAYLQKALPHPDPDRWREVCKLWVARGWQPHLLSGMVDRYHRNAPARASPTHPPVAPAPPPAVGIIELEAIDF